MADGLSGIFQATEAVEIKTAVAERAAEAFDKGVLSRLTPLNKTQLYTAVARAEVDRFAGEFETIVVDQV